MSHSAADLYTSSYTKMSILTEKNLRLHQCHLALALLVAFFVVRQVETTKDTCRDGVYVGIPVAKPPVNLIGLFIFEQTQNGRL